MHTKLNSHKTVFLLAIYHRKKKLDIVRTSALRSDGKFSNFNSDKFPRSSKACFICGSFRKDVSMNFSTICLDRENSKGHFRALRKNASQRSVCLILFNVSNAINGGGKYIGKADICILYTKVKLPETSSFTLS